jgi:hypothetical protein
MRFLLSVCVALLSALPAAALEPDATPRRLTLTPPRGGESALRRRLLPELIEQRPGNAAERYRKAFELLKKTIADATIQQAAAWVEAPLDKLPRAEVKAFLKAYQETLAEAEAGARGEYCDWGQTEKLRQKGLGAPLDEIQEMRTLATLFEVRLRLELAEGEPERAVRTARFLLAMARHTGETPTLIGMLVAGALTARTVDRLEEVVQQPSAPSLYWALSDLPRPFLDLRKPLQGERLLAYSIFLPNHPEAIFDLDAGPLPAEEMKELAGRLYNVSGFNLEAYGNRYTFGFAVLRKHEAAKRALVAAGRPRDKVEAMPHLQVALLHSLDEYDRELDEMLKYYALPYWEAQPRLREAERNLRGIRDKSKDPRSDAPALPVAGYLLPATNKVLGARVRIDRRIALLRCAEALRLYAAGHDGKLPAALADVKNLPLPVDPATGQPFRYEVKGATATLAAEALRDGPNVPSYELTIRLPK